MTYYYELSIDLNSHEIFWTKKKVNYKIETKMNKVLNSDDVLVSDISDVLTPSYYIMSLCSNKNLSSCQPSVPFLVKHLFLNKFKAKKLNFADETAFLLSFIDELNVFLIGYHLDYNGAFL